jgi:hypothetical protein
MEYQEKQLLQASSYRTLPRQIKDELPDWCTDESSFQQYKQLIQISHDLRNDQFMLDAKVKQKLDHVFHEKNKSHWFLLNVLAVGESTNSNQKTVWISIAAVLIVALVSAVFLLQNTPNEVIKNRQLKAKIEKVESKHELKEQDVKSTKPAIQIQAVQVPVQLAVVDENDTALPQNQREPSLMSADAEVTSETSRGEALSVQGYSVPSVSTSYSLADPLFNDVFELIEPTF